MPNAAIIHGDARHLPLADCSVDAVVCDPPYELGFMSKKWDSTGVAYDVATWREALRVLKPGGHLLAFGGMRTQHRLICAIEDAGFDIRDAIVWHVGSGFPKSLNVSAAIDKAAGAEREVVGRYQPPNGKAWNLAADESLPGGGGTMGKFDLRSASMDITAPATDDARRWQGWGTALKPASEIICVARKPLAAGTVAANVLQWGCGALNVDGCRVAGDVPSTTRGMNQFGVINDDGWRPSQTGQRINPHAGGRWPTNVVLSHVGLTDGDGEVIGDACDPVCVDGCPVAELDAQSGERPSGGSQHERSTVTNGVFGQYTAGRNATRAPDSGGASRYFPAFRYQAKAPTRERPKVNGVAHPTVKPLGLMRWLVRLVGGQPGSTILDMFAGSGATIEAALLEGFNAIGVERSAEYLPLIQHRIDRATTAIQPAADDVAEPTLFDVA